MMQNNHSGKYHAKVCGDKYPCKKITIKSFNVIQVCLTLYQIKGIKIYKYREKKYINRI